ncbi:hypothetical protein AVEN_902-1 [Araneus ventricosus]|uniref:Uncharacterized protein n=1 Tax=Araneus ventricosus TaxID=182803 RepID=A0A4Y2DUT0_ARAVE|nr:hypothetical protein AVEN_902-1 [Araneus ventricosus]
MLTSDELYAVICDCESIINCRPLTYVSENPEELTPSMLLVENRSSNTKDIEELNSSSLNKRIKYRSKLLKDLRQRFRKEYLGQLVQKHNEKHSRNRHVGEIVLSSVSDFSLYKSCLRKIAINLKEGAYKSCHENLFSFISSKIVNNIMCAALDIQQSDGLKAEDLEQLLTCGKLRQLKISKLNVRNEEADVIQIINILKSGSKHIEVLHLTGTNDYEVDELLNENELSKAMGNLVKNCPNLVDFHCSISFDLTALRRCHNLRMLRIRFHPKQDWSNFLAIKNGYIQIHKYLEYFTVCQINKSKPIPYKDIVIIPLHCPELTS